MYKFHWEFFYDICIVTFQKQQSNMSKSSEDVLTIVNYVKNKKVVGELYMMSERLAWKPQTKSAFNVSHNYADIKGISAYKYSV